MSTTTTDGSTSMTNARADGTGEETVLLSSEGRIGFVTLNRPERLNAINLSTHLLLAQRLREADSDPATRVVVITGAGRGFCSGGDVKDMVGNESFGVVGRSAVLSPGRDLIDTILRMEKPLIAMVNGVAVGLGATIALLADVVMMADEASIGDRHVSVGLVAGDGGAFIWPLLIGPSRAKEFLMTGRMIKGPDAERLGLISRSVPQAELRNTVLELAEELAALPPYAVQATKASVNRILSAGSGVVLDTSLAYEHLSMKTEDHQEALRARAEERPGVYFGR